MLKQIEPSSTPCSVSLIRPEDVYGVWHLALPLLRKPIEGTGGRLSPETVFAFLTMGQFQLWLVTDTETRCAAVSEIAVYPTGLRALRVLILGGEDLGRWVKLWNIAEQWAAERGCVKAETVGRKGWTEVLADWTQTKVHMEKDIVDA